MNHSTADYLNQLEQDRQDLVDNLETQGITGLTGDETFTELVPEVLNIQAGASLSDYFYDENSQGGSSSSYVAPMWTTYIKKLPSSIEVKSNTTSLSYAFHWYNGDVLDLSNYDTRNITDFSAMFAETKFTTITLGENFSTQSATNLSSMFENNKNIQTLDLSQFGVGPYTTISNMFYECTSLVSVDLRNLKTSSNSCQTTNMFRGNNGLPSLQHIDMRSYDFSSMNVNLGMMFGSSARWGIVDNCEIIVKDATEKSYFNTNLSRLTNVKTAEEYEASLNS